MRHSRMSRFGGLPGEDAWRGPRVTTGGAPRAPEGRRKLVEHRPPPRGLLRPRRVFRGAHAENRGPPVADAPSAPARSGRGIGQQNVAYPTHESSGSGAGVRERGPWPRAALQPPTTNRVERPNQHVTVARLRRPGSLAAHHFSMRRPPSRLTTEVAADQGSRAGGPAGGGAALFRVHPALARGAGGAHSPPAGAWTPGSFPRPPMWRAPWRRRGGSRPSARPSPGRCGAGAARPRPCWWRTTPRPARAGSAPRRPGSRPCRARRPSSTCWRTAGGPVRVDPHGRPTVFTLLPPDEADWVTETGADVEGPPVPGRRVPGRRYSRGFDCGTGRSLPRRRCLSSPGWPTPWQGPAREGIPAWGLSSPATLGFTSEGSPKLLDFGLAHAVDESPWWAAPCTTSRPRCSPAARPRCSAASGASASRPAGRPQPPRRHRRRPWPPSRRRS